MSFGSNVAETLTSQGAFVIHLHPGTYKVTATSPDYNAGKGLCAAPAPVRVTDGGLASVKVYCQIK